MTKICVFILRSHFQYCIIIITIFIAAHMSSGNVDIYGVTKELQKELKHFQLSLHIHNVLIAFFVSLAELNRISNGNEKAKNDA